MQLSQDFFIRLIAIFGLFLVVSLAIFWVGIVWWVSQDVLARSKDKIIVAASVAISAILGPVGVLLYLVIRPKQTIQEANIEIMEREMLLHASATTICPTCNRMAQQDFLACPYCGTQLKYHCHHCQKLVELDWEHCPYCGTKLGDVMPAQLDQPAILQPATVSPVQELNAPRRPASKRRQPALKTAARAIGQAIGAFFAAIGQGLKKAVTSLGTYSQGAAVSASTSAHKMAAATSRAFDAAQATAKSRMEEAKTSSAQPQSKTKTVQPNVPNPSTVSSSTPASLKGSNGTIQFGAAPASLSSSGLKSQTKAKEVDKVMGAAKRKKAARHRA